MIDDSLLESIEQAARANNPGAWVTLAILELCDRVADLAEVVEHTLIPVEVMADAPSDSVANQ